MSFLDQFTWLEDQDDPQGLLYVGAVPRKKRNLNNARLFELRTGVSMK